MVISCADDYMDVSNEVDRSFVSNSADDSRVGNDVISQLLSRGAKMEGTEGTTHDDVRASLESIRSTGMTDLSILEKGGNVIVDTIDHTTLPVTVTASSGQSLPTYIDNDSLPRPHLTTPTTTRQPKSSHSHEPILDRDSVHILDLSAEGKAIISGLEGGLESGGYGLGLGCFVQYTLPGVILDSTSTSPTKDGGVYSLWWDAECPILNGRNHHVFLLDGTGTATTAEGAKGVWDQGIEFTIYNSDNDGALPANPVALATATLSVEQLRSLVSHAGGSEIVDLPLSLMHGGTVAGESRIASTPCVLRLNLAHRIEPTLLKTLSTSVASNIPPLAAKENPTTTTTTIAASSSSSSSSSNAAVSKADTALSNQPSKSPSEIVSLPANTTVSHNVHKSSEKTFERPALAQQLFPEDPRHTSPTSQLRPVTALRIAITVDRLTIQTDILGVGGSSDASALVPEINPVLHSGGSVGGTIAGGGGLGAVLMGGGTPNGALSGGTMLGGESTILHTSDGRAMELFCMVEAAVTDGDSSAGRRIPSGPLGDSFFTTTPCNIPPPDADAVNSHVTWAETGTLVCVLSYFHILLDCPSFSPPPSHHLPSFSRSDNTYILSFTAFVYP